MLPGIAYFVKINLALILFYGFYRLFFYKDTFFHLRRVLLLAFFGIAFVYPLLDVHEWVQRQEPIAEMVTLYSAMLPEVTVTQAAAPDWRTVAWAVLRYGYLAGCTALLVRFFFQLGSICVLAWKSRKTEVCGLRVYVPAKPSGPFSFFRWIFVHPEAHNEKELAEILMHEHTHVAQYHSVDVVLSEWVSIVCWFNPFVWLLKREVRHNLEYLADNVVIRSGCDRKSYQFHLLGLAHHQGMTDLYNSFNVLHLKNRISMMNKKRSRGIIRAKYLLFFPLAAMLMLLSNIEAMARVTESFVKERMDAGRAQGDIQVKGKVLDSNSQPVIGANVLIKGTTSGTISDLDGNFVLTAPSDGVLLFSFTGYQPKEIEIKDLARTDGTVWLQPKVSEAGGQVFTVVEKMPVYPGGQSALLRKLASEIRYP
ncbi:MAG: carboxypeptidase-like regulatory domain-containing protein, partial [Parabacteroides sp.]|nr:carboxypeptidase-like regulatory domain-containing protein [Parabacteroides sp.]